jgi:hypothetical protein
MLDFGFSARYFKGTNYQRGNIHFSGKIRRSELFIPIPYK